MKLHTEWVLLSNSGIIFVVNPPDQLWIRLDEQLPILSETFAADVLQLMQSKENIVALLCIAELKEFLEGAHRFSNLGGHAYTADSVLRLALAEPETHELENALALACSQDVFPQPNATGLLGLLLAYPDAYTRHLECQALEALKGKFPAKHEGFVYLMRLGTGEYKIGYSTNVAQRNRQLSSGMPHKLSVVHTIPTNQMACLEHELHTRFRTQRVLNTEEWFNLTDEDVRYICQIDERHYPWVETPEQYPDLPTGKFPADMPAFGQFKPLEMRPRFGTPKP